jgi:hypothetical protein
MFDAEGALSGNTINWLIEVPEEAWAKAQILQALYQLTDRFNWQVQGDGTDDDIDDCVEFFFNMLRDFIET